MTRNLRVSLLAGFTLLICAYSFADVRSIRLGIALNCPYGLAG